MSEPSRDDVRDLLPGYAAGALDPGETRAVETALAESPELRRELAEYRELAALLGSAVVREPPAGLKTRLLERIREERTAIRPAPADATRIVPRAVPARRSLAGPLLGLGLAASLLIAAGLFLQNRDLARRLAAADSAAADLSRRVAARDSTLAALLAPGVQLTTLTSTGREPPVVRVFWDRGRNRLTLSAVRLPRAPAGRAYQLWLMRKDAPPIPSRVFDTGPDGGVLAENVALPAGETIVGFAVSVEPAGGSPQPTTTPILFGEAAGE